MDLHAIARWAGLVGGLLWLGILMLLSLSDFVSRGWIPAPGH